VTRNDFKDFFPEIQRKPGPPYLLPHSGRLIIPYVYSKNGTELEFDFDTDDDRECAPRFGIGQKLLNSPGE
jgi:hypothetical protein